MGIIHFAGLGRSPGAVTSGLVYLQHEYSDLSDYGQIAESVVLFTSPEVADGTRPAYESVHNEYMNLTVKRTWSTSERSTPEIITEFFKREIPRATLYICQVDVNDFSVCFDAVAKATLRFHPPGDVGKHIWVNITGGTNPLNAALFQTAYLSGFISRLYYTFIADPGQYGKYLQPFSRDPKLFDFREIYVLKTAFDERYLHIVEELEIVTKEEPQKWLSSEELLGRLKSKGIPGFARMNPKAFLLNFLHVMQGRGIQRRDTEDAIRFDLRTGPAILSILRSDLVGALFKQETISNGEVERLTQDLKLRKF